MTSPFESPKLRVLHLCYASLTEPLVHTQVIAYLRGLAALGHTVHLLTFETEKLTPAYRRYWRGRLKADGIHWHALRYHLKPALPSSLFDIAAGALKATQLVLRHRLQAVHARAQVAVAMGLLVQRLTGCRLLFDLRGLMAEERQESGYWEPHYLSFRAVKRLESIALRRADAVVVLTERMHNALALELADKSSMVIPCCADLDHIEAAATGREAMRQRLGLEEKIVLLYAGKLGGYYLGREMAAFFLAARKVLPHLHFLVLSQSEHDVVRAELAECGLAAEDFTLTRTDPEDLGAYLAAADGAIALRAVGPAQMATSPTKIGEYLAAGLPVIFNPGIGDVDAILNGAHCGICLPEFTAAGYEGAARQWQALLKDPETAVRSREAAHRHFSLREIGVPRYHAVYRALAGGPEVHPDK